MANVKISNLPVETVLANMTGIAGYNASGTVQISGATIDSAFAKSNSDLQFIVNNGNVIDGNTGTGNILFKNSSNFTSTTIGVNAISSDTSFSIIGTTNNTNLTFTSGGELRFTPNASSGTPAPGDVLAAKNVQGDVEWVAPGGPTPGIGDVLNASQNTFSGQKINFINGGTVAEVSTAGIFAGGNFTIAQGGNDTLVLGNAASPTNLLCGAGQISLGDTSNNITISTNGSDKIQLSCNGTGEVEFYLGSNNPGPAIGDVLTAKTTSGQVEWTTPATPENSLTISNTVDTDMFDDGVVRLWWDVSASDIELEITNQGGGSGSTSSVYHASYTNFDGSSTSTTTTDFNAQNATTTGTLDFNFSTDEVMILRLWTPDTSLQPGFGYYEVTFTKSSSLYTGTPILCSVRKSSL